MFSKLNEYFHSKSREQVFSICLLAVCFILIIICAIARCCGILIFSADLSIINITNSTIQVIIKACLLLFELVFVYKILCKIKFIYCFIIAVIEVIILGFISNTIIVFIIEIVLYFGIPVLVTKDLYSLLDSLVLFVITNLYSLIFCYGRFGNIDTYYAYSFIHGVLSTIDYKLLFVAIFLIIKSFGGIKLWKRQKRMLFQAKKDLK